MKIVPTLAICALTVAGCARTPHATISYPLARTDLHLTVARTVKCTKDNEPYVADQPDVAVSYSADPTAIGTLDTSKLDGAFTDTSLDLHFAADQRLKSVNATSTGQGETILRAAISLASSVFFPKLTSESTADTSGVPTPEQIKQACIELAMTFADAGMTISYSADFDPSSEKAFIPLKVLPQDLARSVQYSPLLGSVCAQFAAHKEPTIPVAILALAANYATLTARQPRLGALRIAVSPHPTVCPIASDKGFIWGGTVPVGQLGTEYQIPIPHAAAFGTQSFDLVLDDSGALTQLKYGKVTGAGQAIAVAQQAADAVKPSTDTERAAAINAEIALRKAQEHRAKCLADPAAC